MHRRRSKGIPWRRQAVLTAWRAGLPRDSFWTGRAAPPPAGMPARASRSRPSAAADHCAGRPASAVSTGCRVPGFHSAGCPVPARPRLAQAMSVAAGEAETPRLRVPPLERVSPDSPISQPETLKRPARGGAPGPAGNPAAFPPPGCITEGERRLVCRRRWHAACNALLRTGGWPARASFPQGAWSRRALPGSARAGSAARREARALSAARMRRVVRRGQRGPRPRRHGGSVSVGLSGPGDGRRGHVCPMGRSRRRVAQLGPQPESWACPAMTPAGSTRLRNPIPGRAV